MFRAVSATEVRVNKETRTVDFSFSSEYPVDRWFGKEILSHKDGSADLSRLNNGGALLWNHNTGDLRGVIEKAEIRDGRGFATARFSKSAAGDQLMQDVMDGICRNVSFGYMIQDMTQMNPGADSEPEYLATKWSPYEVSFVSVPADPTVGMGRADEGEETEVNVVNQKPMGVIKMDPKEQAALEAKIRAEAQEAERARIASISALGEKFKMEALSRELVNGGKSVEEARAAFLDKLGFVQKPLNPSEGDLGLSEKEKREFSFVRILAALANPSDRVLQEAAKFEREISEAQAKKTGKTARGFLVPTDILRMAGKRDLTVGTSTAGGNTVATNLLGGSFIDILRNRSAVMQLGAVTLNGLQGNIAIPRQTGAGTGYWVAEGNAPTESAQAFDQVTMSPKTVGAFTDYSRKLLLQSSIDVEAFVRNDLAQVLALKIDLAALYGLGSSNEPTGLKPALNAYNSASQELNLAAATPTFAEVVSLETKIAALNADVANMKYLANASMYGALKAAVKVSGYPVYILEDGMVNGYPIMRSNQSASGDIWFGDWSSLMLGFWSGLDIMVDPYTGSSAGNVRIVALQDCDIAVRHPDSFARGNDTP